MAGTPQKRAAAGISSIGLDAEIGDRSTVVETRSLERRLETPEEAERIDMAAVDWASQPQRLFTNVTGQWIFLGRLERRISPEDLEKQYGRSTFRQVPLFTKKGVEDEVLAYARIDNIGVSSAVPLPTSASAASSTSPATVDPTASLLAALPNLLAAFRPIAPVADGGVSAMMAAQVERDRIARDDAREERRNALAEQSAREDRERDREDRREREDRARDEAREAREQTRQDRLEKDRRDDKAAADALRSADRAAMLTLVSTMLPSVMSAMRPAKENTSDLITQMMDRANAMQTQLLESTRQRNTRDPAAEQMTTFLTQQLAQTQAALLAAQTRSNERSGPDPLGGMGAMMAQMKMFEQMQRMFAPHDDDDDEDEDDSTNAMMQTAMMAFVANSKPELLPMITKMMDKGKNKRDDDDDDDGEDDDAEREADKMVARVQSNPKLMEVVARRFGLTATEPAPELVATPPEVAQHDVGTGGILARVKARREAERAAGL